MLHLIPLESLDEGRPLLDLEPLWVEPRFRPMYADVAGARRWNIDGLYADDADETNLPSSYLQIYRSGIVEGVDGMLASFRADEHVLLGYPIERMLGEDTSRFLSLQRQIGVAPPVVALISLLGCSGRRIMGAEDRPGLSRRFNSTIDRDTLLLPDVTFDSYDLDPFAVLRPAFDAFWQSGGRPKSPNYVDGVWQRRD